MKLSVTLSIVTAGFCWWVGFPLWYALVPLLLIPVCSLIGLVIVITFFILVCLPYGSEHVKDLFIAIKEGVLLGISDAIK
ncbi:hypothetical protein PHYNN_95 [Pantoea phage Phynn]|nr:hypothetical protein PHYNN_95 [Pantoea phage Phynn]